MTTASATSRVWLARGRVKPFWYRHPWVFHGAIARVEGKPADGDVVELVDESGRFVASGFFNANSQIRVRLVSFEPKEEVGAALVRSRIREAVEFRRSVLGIPNAETDSYRLIHSEGDGLPGLVADIYGDVAVMQFGSLGMRRFLDPVIDALRERLSVRAVFERVSGFSVEKEALFGESGVRYGELPETTIPYRQNGIRFFADVARGQKTGAYLDQRENQMKFAALCHGRRVLDLHCHTGGFALAAAVRGGAKSARGVDSSERAVALARRASEENPGAEGVEIIEADASEVLLECASRGDLYDAITLDPPKFARSRDEREGAVKAYVELASQAMRALRPGGILLCCSCSFHVSEEDVLFALNAAGRDCGRTVQVFDIGGQSPDHPIRTPLVEGRYLKAVFCRVL